MTKPIKVYPVFGPTKRLAPDYDRVVRGLSFEDLVGDLAAGAGELGYRRAVAAEVDRRLAQEAEGE